MYRPDAEKTVRRQLVLEAVKDAEKIEAQPEDIDKELAKYAEMFKKSVEEYKAGLKPEELEYFTDSAVVNKTLEFLKENNQAVKPAAKKAAKKPAAKKTAKKAADAQEKEADAADAEQAQEKE